MRIMKQEKRKEIAREFKNGELIMYLAEKYFPNKNEDYAYGYIQSILQDFIEIPEEE
jgi:hypothetical protein